MLLKFQVCTTGGTNVFKFTIPLWIFIRHLKDAQSQTETSIDADRRGDPPPRPTKKWKLINRQMVKHAAKLHAGNTTLDKYWKIVAHYFRRYYTVRGSACERRLNNLFKQ
jgi:hypothetical protein